MSDNTEPHVAKALQDISSSVSVLVSEEIALAKAEVTDRVTSLGRGAGIGVAAGIFLFFALIMASHAVAWGFYALVGAVWAGYLLAMVFFIVLAGIAGFIAIKLLKKGGTPVPTMAIAEAQATKQAVTDARKNA